MKAGLFVVKVVAPGIERGDTARFPQRSLFHNSQNPLPAGRYSTTSRSRLIGADRIKFQS